MLICQIDRMSEDWDPDTPPCPDAMPALVGFVGDPSKKYKIWIVETTGLEDLERRFDAAGGILVTLNTNAYSPAVYNVTIDDAEHF